MLNLVIVLVALIGVTFGLPQSHDLTPGGRIIGGDETSITEHPYQVALYFHSSYICGGVLLSHNWVITTAYCVDSWSINGLSVRAGSTRVSGGGQTAHLTEVILHNRYNRRTLDHDFALLHIRGSIAVRDASPVKLPPADREIHPGEIAVISGWGRINVDNEYPEILHVAEVPIIARGICERQYKGYMITAAMFCGGVLGVHGKDASHGDRGGPVIINGELVGLISWAINHGEPDKPDVYASIPSVRNWIKEVTGL